MSKQVILTGIRANNDLTIGNYFGAILPAIDMAKNRSDEYQVNLFVPDLHSFTTPTDLSQLSAAIWNNLRIFAAAGLPLDNPDIHIYRQSFIPAHSELTWILSCFTGFGEMSRMTQFKDKSKQMMTAQDGEILTTQTGESLEATIVKAGRISVGLFEYPILMASDILLYGATYIPVGEDQTQHLEFTRDIAERINVTAEKYGHGTIFTVPKSVKEQHEFFGDPSGAGQGLRIKDLQDPNKKMSKSDDSGKGVIFLGDNPEEAAKKIMSAATDSLGSVHFDWQNQPGITNLLQILALFTNRSQDEVSAEWEGKSSYGELKEAVAEATRGFLEGLQGRLAQIDDTAIAAKLEQSEAAMREAANQTLYKVQKMVGLR